MDKHPFSEADESGMRSAQDIASRGTPWELVSDAYLVGFVSELHNKVHTPAIIEMQRRVTVAIRDFNEQSQKHTAALIALAREAGEQNATMIRLTKWIIALTIVLGVLTALQLGGVFSEPISGLLRGRPTWR